MVIGGKPPRLRGGIPPCVNDVGGISPCMAVCRPFGSGVFAHFVHLHSFWLEPRAPRSSQWERPEPERQASGERASRIERRRHADDGLGPTKFIPRRHRHRRWVQRGPGAHADRTNFDGRQGLASLPNRGGVCTICMGLKVTCYGFTCPLNDACKAGGRWFKGKSPSVAKTALWNHLSTSTYHTGQDQDFIKNLVDTMSPEEWEEDVEDEARWNELEDERWAARKRKAGAAALHETAARALNNPRLADHQLAAREAFPGPLRLARSGEFPSRTGGCFVKTPVAPDDMVTLSGIQTQVIMDSMARTRIAAEMCVVTTERALSAFKQEVKNIGDMQDLCFSWLANQADPSSASASGS